ncbi:MAG: Nif3-like dinuclear metal center hexameric protein [Deltaproteobacteria bacterium]|nr:Nif3-like dinuclear metal center hexameric protein [Deltaproteobacteria bacterium]
MATVQDLLNILNDIAADDLAETWDNVGLLIGSPDHRISAVLLALDPTVELIDQAQNHGAELVITHHPAIFHPLKSLRTDQPVGNFISSALQAGISVISCHTNLDSTRGGVSDVLAQTLGLVNTEPLVAVNNCNNACGLGRIGNLETAVTPDTFIAGMYSALSPPWLLEAGPRPELVSRVAVCGGSCSDLSETALQAGADVFITAEVKHAVARWAEEAGLWLIDGGHFTTENPAMPALQQLLAHKLKQADMAVQIHSASQDPPLKLITV